MIKKSIAKNPKDQFQKFSVVAASWKAGSGMIFRPTWVEINRNALAQNIQSIKSFLKPKTKIMAVVKANAYGHSAQWAAKTALACGVSCLGVACLEEGIELRKSGVNCEILILGSIFPLENFAVALKYNLTPTVSSLQGLEALIETSKNQKKKPKFHLKVDTGMGRMGASVSGSIKIIDRLVLSSGIEMTGVYTHFAVAGTDKKFTQLQLNKFNSVLNYAKKSGLKFIAHAANSSAIINNESSHFDMVRPGLVLYGMYPFFGARKKIQLSPVMTWKTRIVFLKKVPKGTSISYSRTFVTKRASVIATLPVGYADGYSRRLSNKAEVLVRGRRCRVVGRVTMDMIMIDVTDVPGVETGDEVVLLGKQGEEKIRAEELANIAGTINYEMTCGISCRVPRVFI